MVGADLRHQACHTVTDLLDLVGGESVVSHLSDTTDAGTVLVEVDVQLGRLESPTRGTAYDVVLGHGPDVNRRTWLARGMDDADRVLEAFAAVPRSGFLRRGTRSRARDDVAILIGHGQTNSQPSTVADMLRLLDVRPGQRVLDVGSGSGWTTALLAHLTGAQGEVLGLEMQPELARWGAANLATAGMPWAAIREPLPGVLGDPDHAPWDRILVSAEASRLPPPLVEQLADPGRLLVPVAGTLTLVVRRAGSTTASRHGHYRFVSLRTVPGDV